jgi:hypothetical protein
VETIQPEETLEERAEDIADQEASTAPYLQALQRLGKGRSLRRSFGSVA